MSGKPAAKQILFVHWNQEEAERLAIPLRESGWEVRFWPAEFKDLKANPPSAILISLQRLPSHGRQVADAIWQSKWGRSIPLLFIDGAPDKVDAARKKFPQARFVAWADVAGALASLSKPAK